MAHTVTWQKRNQYGQTAQPSNRSQILQAPAPHMLAPADEDLA